MEQEPMAGTMRTATRTFALILGSLLAGGLAATVCAADAPAATAAAPAAPAEEPLEELDQIVVRGESIIKAIADAEDNFYDLFNKLNTDDDYDTNCVYLQLDPTTRINSRVCL